MTLFHVLEKTRRHAWRRTPQAASEAPVLAAGHFKGVEPVQAEWHPLRAAQAIYLLRISWVRFYFGDLRVVASYSCGPSDTREALSLIERGIVTAEKVGASLVALEDVPRAYRKLAQGRIVKPIVCFE